MQTKFPYPVLFQDQYYIPSLPNRVGAWIGYFIHAVPESWGG